MATATLTSSIVYTPPLATTTSSFSLNVTESYTPLSVGTIDIPIGTAATTTYDIPFGSISSADLVILKNKNNQEMGVRINGIPIAPAYLFQIPQNGEMIYGGPVPVTGSPLTAVQLEIPAMQAGIIGQIDYYIFAVN